jgi:PIF1-like helicase
MQGSLEDSQPAAEQPTVALNEIQGQAVDVVLGSIDKGGKLVMLFGKAGTGKSTTIKAIHWEVDQLFGKGATRLTATTGQAGMVIGGSTVHSSKAGLGLPVAKSRFKELGSLTRRLLHERYRIAKVLVLGEFSMLRQKELYWVNLRLQEIMGNDLPFGGLVVVLSGDPAQLPAVLGRVLWDRSGRGCSAEDSAGLNVYTMYSKDVIELKCVEQVTGVDEEATFFTGMQLRLADGMVTDADYVQVRDRCSEHTLGPTEWEAMFGASQNPTYLFCTNPEVRDYNHNELKKCGNPIVLIEAKNTGIAKGMQSDRLYGLECALFWPGVPR